MPTIPLDPLLRSNHLIRRNDLIEEHHESHLHITRWLMCRALMTTTSKLLTQHSSQLLSLPLFSNESLPHPHLHLFLGTQLPRLSLLVDLLSARLNLRKHGRHRALHLTLSFTRQSKPLLNEWMWYKLSRQ